MAHRPGRVKYRVIIADDEPLARERVRTLLREFPEFTVVAECGDGDQTIEAIGTHLPDLIFLDVRMPGLDGFEVAEAIEAAGHRVAIVFVTAFGEHALRAFDVGAVDYLMKPFDVARFRLAIERAERELQGGASLDPALRKLLESLRDGERRIARFVVRAAKHIYFVPVEDVEWIDAAANYVRLHAGGRAHLVRDTIAGAMAKLDPQRFVRVHRSAIVRIDQIAKLEPHERGDYLITLRDGSRLTSSRSYSPGLRELIR